MGSAPSSRIEVEHSTGGQSRWCRAETSPRARSVVTAPLRKAGRHRRCCKPRGWDSAIVIRQLEGALIACHFDTAFERGLPWRAVVIGAVHFLFCVNSACGWSACKSRNDMRAARKLLADTFRSGPSFGIRSVIRELFTSGLASRADLAEAVAGAFPPPPKGLSCPRGSGSLPAGTTTLY